MALVSLIVTRCIEFSGVFHGPPLLDQPAQLCMASFKPRRSASRAACFISSRHSGVRNLTGPGGDALRLKTSALPMPTRCIASRSAVMPALVMLPSIQCHQMSALAEAGGAAKYFSSSLAVIWVPRIPNSAKMGRKRFIVGAWGVAKGSRKI